MVSTIAEVELIAYLLNRQEENLKQTKTVLNIKTEDVLESIKSINEKVDDTILINEEDVVVFKKDNVNQIFKANITNRNAIFKYLTIDYRRSFILVTLLTNKKYFSLLDIADLAGISKNTALNDINFLRRDLLKKDIKLEYSRKKGYILTGEELVLRDLLTKEILKLIKKPVGKYLLFELALVDSNEINIVKQKLERVEQRLSIIFSDVMFESLPFTILAVTERIRNFEIKCFFSKELLELKETKEYITISSMFWNYNFLNENDLLYLVILVLSSNIVDSVYSLEYSNKNIDKLQNLVEEVILNLEKRFAFDFSNKDKLADSLLQHMIPAIYRNLLNLHVVNPLEDQFMFEYKGFYKVVEQEMHRFDSLTQQSFTKSEITFIAMLILGHIIEESEVIVQKFFTAVVICKSGTSVSKLLKEQLNDLFPSIKFNRVLSLRQYETQKVNEDFIFSTIPVNGQDNIFLVNSFMSEKEKKILKEKVEKSINSDSRKKTEYIISYLSDYLKDNQEEEAIEKLQHFFNKEQVGTEDKFPILNNKEQITIFHEDVEWNQVIEKSFTPLLERNSVTKRYIEKCKRIFNNSYDKMLIGPNFLMPHSSYEDGVVYPDVQINIFKKPLEAPNQEKYWGVIALAPGERNEHLEWIIYLNDLLLKTNFQKHILNTDHKDKIFSLLKQ